MPAAPAAPIAADEPIARPLSDDQIARERAAARQKPGAIPDEPMDAESTGVVGHPSDMMQSMIGKLEKGMAEVNKKESKTPGTPYTGPDDNKQQTDSKRKPAETPDDKKDDKAAASDANKSPADDPADKTITSAKAADWKALKESRDTYKKTATELEQKHTLLTKEYDEFRKKAVAAEEIDKVRGEMKTLTEERDKLQEHLQTVALERSEKFSKHFEKKFTDAISKAKEAVGNDNAERIDALMQLPASAWRKERINEIREELDGVDQGQLDIALSSYDSARNEKDGELKNSKENYQRLVQLESEKAAAQRATMEKRTEAALAATLSVARDNYESFKPTDDKEHNAFVAENEEFVKKFFQRKLNDTELAALPVLASEAKRLANRVVPCMQKEIAELKAALKEFQGSNPAPNGGAPSSVPKGEQGEGFVATFNRHWPAGNR